MWNESWANIQLELADSIRYDYGSKEPTQSDVFDMNNAQSVEMLKRMASNQNRR